MSVTIEEIRNLNDPQRSYDWRVTMPANLLNPISAGPVGDVTNEVLEDIQSATTGLPPRLGSIAQQTSGVVRGQLGRFGLVTPNFNISNQVEEVQGLPFPGTDKSVMYEGGRNTYFPEIENVDSVSITFYLDQSDRVFRYFKAWRELMINPDGTKNLPGTYKKPINVKLLNGRNKSVFDYTLVGCFPTSTTPLSLTQESGRMTVTQEFSVDRVIYNEPSEDGVLTPKEALFDKLDQKTSEVIRADSNFVNGQLRDLI